MIKIWYGCLKAEIGKGINADLAFLQAQPDALAERGEAIVFTLVKLERSNAHIASVGDAAGAFLAQRNH